MRGVPSDGVQDGDGVVGQVSDITTSNFQANLTLEIKKTVRLFVGTTAQIRFDNPLGDEYVILSEPVAPTSSPGAAMDVYACSIYAASLDVMTGELCRQRPDPDLGLRPDRPLAVDVMHDHLRHLGPQSIIARARSAFREQQIVE